MKKNVVMMLTAASFLLAPAVYAEPVKLTGDVSAKYERDTAEGAEATSGSIFTLRLMGEADLGAGWSLYARLGVQGLSQSGLGDFNTGYYGQDKKSVAEIDQFGVVYKTENLTYKLGRQDATVGATALLYSRPDTNIGKRSFVDGLAVSGTVGATDLTVLLGREDNPEGTASNKIYAARAGFHAGETLDWGFTLGRYQDNDNGSTNHYAVDGTFKFDKNSLTAEFAKSSRSEDNKAYAVTLNHDFDDKTAVYVTGFRVEANGDMGGQSDFDNGNRGVYYGLTRKLSEAASLEMVYKDQRLIADGTKNTKFEATLSYSF